jgi:ubiquinol-cytochrome c reductase cytochrome c1 subunit
MIRRFALCALFAAGLFSAVEPRACAADSEPAALLPTTFSFDGMFGTIDKAAAQRGLQIYREVCSACHGLYELHYGDIAALGYNEDQVKTFAAQFEVPDIADDGSVIQRPARAADFFVRPFPNEKAARNANNGALPPDLALIAKSRAGGPHYVYSLLQGYRDPPPDVKMGDGMNYNIYFAGHQLAMPQPLQDATVTFSDGTKNDLAQEAHDVATFLEWAANPELDERKQLGARVMLFLVILAIVLYGAKRIVWRDVH